MDDARRLIAEAGITAERTVGFVRIFVALFLGAALFAAVLRFVPGDHDVLQRQMGLAFAGLFSYLILGIISVVVSKPRSYRPWVSWVFVTLDAVFVVVSAALSLINSGSPANYVAALPVLWVVPLVLVFGALRYNPWIQGYIVIVLIAGLIGGAFVAGSWVPTLGVAPPATINIFFGFPPNVMRLVMIGLAGVVLVIAVSRARSLLIRAIGESQRRLTLTRYLPPQIADWLSETSVDDARRGHRQPVAILFADIRGFTRRAETMDPIELGRFVTEFRRCVSAAAEAHHGVIDKFVGDSAMVVFGVPQPSAADAGNALACAERGLANLAGTPGLLSILALLEYEVGDFVRGSALFDQVMDIRRRGEIDMAGFV